MERARSIERDPLVIEDALSKSGVESVLEKINFETFSFVLPSARRVGKIYGRDPLEIGPGEISEELGYLGLDVPGRDEIKSNLDIVHEVHLALDPLVEALSQFAYWKSERKYDIQDILFCARERTLRTLSVHANLTAFRKGGATEIVRFVSSSLAHLEVDVFRKLQRRVSFESLEDHLKDPLGHSPELYVIQKEELEELLRLIDSLPNEVKNTIFHIASHVDGVDDGVRKRVREILAEKMGRPELTFVERSKFSSSDVDYFWGLKLGQVFWLIANLPVVSQVIVFHRFGYIHSADSTKEIIEKFGFRSKDRFDQERRLALERLANLERRFGEDVPSLETGIDQYIKEALRYRYTKKIDGRSLPRRSPNSQFLLGELNARPELLEILAPQEQRALRLLLKGHRIKKVGEIMGIKPRSVSCILSRAASRVKV